MNILIVDDSAMMRGIIKQAISDNTPNFEVNFEEAADGEQALLCIKSKKIDLVFVDWNMPVLDGLGFVRKVRGEGNRVPIIMITSVTLEDKISEAVSAGVNSYIEKPIKGNHLWEQIKEFVK